MEAKQLVRAGDWELLRQSLDMRYPSARWSSNARPALLHALAQCTQPRSREAWHAALASPELAEVAAEQLGDAERCEQRAKKLFDTLQRRWQRKSRAAAAQQTVRTALQGLSVRRQWELSLYALHRQERPPCSFAEYWIAASLARQRVLGYCEPWDWPFWAAEIAAWVRTDSRE